MGKCYFKAYKIKRSTLPRGTLPSWRWLRGTLQHHFLSVTLPPLDSRGQPWGSHPLLDFGGWDRHLGGWGGQEMSAALKNSVGGDRKQTLGQRGNAFRVIRKSGLELEGPPPPCNKSAVPREPSPWKELEEARVGEGWGGPHWDSIRLSPLLHS